MADQHLRADVELEMAEDWAGDPLPPVLEQAKLGDLGLFQEELRRRSHPLDFRAGHAVYSNRTPLHLAAMHGHHEIVQFILHHPSISLDVVNAKDCYGYTPLHLAIRALDESVVKLLTESLLVHPDKFLIATCEPDDLEGSYGGFTPLHFAALKESPDIARLLLRQPYQVHFAHDPVNFQATTWRGHTPLNIARQKLFLTDLDVARKQKIEELVELLENSDQNWLQQERERNAMSANAILVGAALVAAAAFGSWLQPPGGIPAANSSPGSADSNRNSVFYLFVVCAFSFSVIALVIGTLATFPYTAVSVQVEVQQLRRAVSLARKFMVAAVFALIFCFVNAGKLVLYKVATVNGKFSNVRFKIITWLPLITYLYIAYFTYSYKSRMGGFHGNKTRFTIITLMLVGLGIGAVVLTTAEKAVT